MSKEDDDDGWWMMMMMMMMTWLWYDDDSNDDDDDDDEDDSNDDSNDDEDEDEWPMTYLMMLSNWTMSCQPGLPRAHQGQCMRYKQINHLSLQNPLWNHKITWRVS